MFVSRLLIVIALVALALLALRHGARAAMEPEEIMVRLATCQPVNGVRSHACNRPHRQRGKAAARTRTR